MDSQDKVIGINDLIDDPYSAVGKMFHHEDEMMLPGGPVGEALSEMVAFLSGGAPDIISIDGIVVYTDGHSAIVRVTHHFLEYELYFFSYEEIVSRYPDFEDKPETRFTPYVIVSFSDEYFVPSDPALLEQDDENLESEEMPKELQETVLRCYEDYKKGNIEIQLPIDDLLSLDPQGLYNGINRTSHWLANTDCAIVTAWRAGLPRNQNDSNNAALQNALRENGFGVIKVKGYYAEVGHESSSENSFIVIKRPPSTSQYFYDTIFDLSKKYNQDCFLYKEAGLDTPAFLIGTNEEWGMGRKEKIGMFRVNEMSPEAYSRVGSGTISFSKKSE